VKPLPNNQSQTEKKIGKGKKTNNNKMGEKFVKFQFPD
jgi:hypothetical protein